MQTNITKSCISLDQVGYKIWKYFGWDNHNECKYWKTKFQMPNTQWRSYFEEAFDSKQGNDKTFWQLYVHLTNVLLKCR